MPTDEETKNKLLQNSNLESKYLFLNSIDVIKLCCIVSLGLAVIYTILTHCFPRFMNVAAVYAGILLTLGLTICFFTYPSNSGAKIPIAIFFLIVFIILLFNWCVHKKTFEMHGVYLEAATKMLGDDKCCTFAYIPLFLAMTVGFIFILILELKSFLGGGTLHFDKDESIFWEFSQAN